MSGCDANEAACDDVERWRRAGAVIVVVCDECDADDERRSDDDDVVDAVDVDDACLLPLFLTTK